MRVSKKLERLCRATFATRLWRNGFPLDRIQGRVDEAWMAEIPDAEALMEHMKAIEDHELDGSYTQSQLDQWGED